MKEKYCIFYENPAADGSLAEYSTEKGEKGRKRGRKKKEGRGKGCWSGATRRRKISSPCSTRIKVKRMRPEEHKGFPWHFITPEPTVASVARDQPSFSLSFEFCPLPPVPRFAWPRGNLRFSFFPFTLFSPFLSLSFYPFLSLRSRQRSWLKFFNQELGRERILRFRSNFFPFFPFFLFSQEFYFPTLARELVDPSFDFNLPFTIFD